ncbi:MAG: TlyA family RNA methyltransferase [Thiobacillaceae bacterium]
MIGCADFLGNGVMRADQLLARRGLAPSRTAAQRLIEAGRVRFEQAGRDGRVWQTVTKASLDLPEDTPLDLLPGSDDRFVSRGGQKLAGALAHTGLAVAGLTCLDVGQSTGGFTDCLVQAGAARVVGVDVGHGQLHPRLRADARVVCLEGVNARHLSAELLGPNRPVEGFDLIVADLSFISLTLILPRLPPLLAPAGHLLLLVKPQFELGPRARDKRGIVRDSRLYDTVKTQLHSACAANGLEPMDWFPSPITGADGNREFFLFARLGR